MENLKILIVKCLKVSFVGASCLFGSLLVYLYFNPLDFLDPADLRARDIIFIYSFSFLGVFAKNFSGWLVEEKFTNKEKASGLILILLNMAFLVLLISSYNWQL